MGLWQVRSVCAGDVPPPPGDSGLQLSAGCVARSVDTAAGWFALLGARLCPLETVFTALTPRELRPRLRELRPRPAGSGGQAGIEPQYVCPQSPAVGPLLLPLPPGLCPQ